MATMTQSREDVLSTSQAAPLFRISRQSFYKFAERHGIRDLTEENPAKRTERRFFSKEDIIRVYRELYGKDPDI